MHKISTVIGVIAFCALEGFSQVDQNTGKMSYGGNLASIGGQTISLDLGLQYSSGIIVNQRGSWVGLGFDISLPYVERTVIGSADEKSGSESYCFHYFLKKDYNKLLLPSSNGYSGYPDEGEYTAQQDIYTLSAPFANGRIVFPMPASA